MATSSPAGYTDSYGEGGDVYLVKTDEDGNEQWHRNFGGEKEEYAFSVQQTSDGGYIITGWTKSYGEGGEDVYLVKADEYGNEQWHRTFGGEGHDWAISVQQTSDGGYIIAGGTGSYGEGRYDVYLVKTDEEGNEEWHRTFGGAEDDSARSVQQTSDGGHIIAGWTKSYGEGGEDVYLVKADGYGNKQWHRTFGGAEVDSACSVQQTSDGGYIIAGYTDSYGEGGDVYLVKTDGEGNEEWQRTFGGEKDDRAYSVQQTSDGGYIIAGYTDSYGEGRDVYLVKTDEEGN